MTKELIELKARFESQTNDAQSEELYNAILNTPPGDIVEVGSAAGGTTVVLIHAAIRVGKKVISIDPYPEDMEGKADGYSKGLMKGYREKFTDNILNGDFDNIIQYNENTEDCIDKIPEKLSVVFIDGMHEYSFAKKESELLFPKLVPGGIMYFHDILFDRGQLTQVKGNGVWDIKDLFPSGEFVGEHPWIMYKVTK
jgi:predicted O-methyltransferase YrrM